jgi:hypothetical protein
LTEINGLNSMADSEMIRCTSCKGAKKVAKLGGVIGVCNTCDGTGKIKLTDKPVFSNVELQPSEAVVIKSVAECMPVAAPEITDTKGKRAIYKRKSA